VTTFDVGTRGPTLAWYSGAIQEGVYVSGQRCIGEPAALCLGVSHKQGSESGQAIIGISLGGGSSGGVSVTRKVYDLEDYDRYFADLLRSLS
jgi:hypothetical protein